MKTGFVSRVVMIGGLPLGGTFPVRIQSMTNTPTMDTVSTVRQTERMVQAGCELVRITARNVAEARNLAEIKKELHSKGITVPLIADIHYNPEAALVAAEIVEKVRINPGNYVDRPPEGKEVKAYSEAEYKAELNRIAERLHPLVSVCMREGTAIRVGTNHGSLSQRILDRFGNTPAGMVESALEFVRILSGMGFEKLVLSMKASDINVMMKSCRLLVAGMNAEGFAFPLHLGVTEAGAGEDGILRSACGIGPLLAEGLGDTIRVSLTGPPESELPAARQLVELYAKQRTQPFDSLCPEGLSEGVPAKPALITQWEGVSEAQDLYLPSGMADERVLEVTGSELRSHPERIRNFPGILVLNAREAGVREDYRLLRTEKISGKIALRVDASDLPAADAGIFLAAKSSEFLECRGIDYLWCHSPRIQESYQMAQSVLQSHGLRRTRAEFISCPSCGRTEFDIEKVLNEVKTATSHLTHLKIAVMGCIVNGPGEMADADYGCVGMGKKKVVLYKSGKAVERDIPEEEVSARLCALIKRSGDWKDRG